MTETGRPSQSYIPNRGGNIGGREHFVQNLLRLRKQRGEVLVVLRAQKHRLARIARQPVLRALGHKQGQGVRIFLQHAALDPELHRVLQLGRRDCEIGADLLRGQGLILVPQQVQQRLLTAPRCRRAYACPPRTRAGPQNFSGRRLQTNRTTPAPSFSSGRRNGGIVKTKNLAFSHNKHDRIRIFG